MRRRVSSIPRVSYKPQRVARDYALTRSNKLCFQVCIVEAVALVIAQPHSPSAASTRADATDSSRPHGDHRRSSGREDVNTVVTPFSSLPIVPKKALNGPRIPA